MTRTAKATPRPRFATVVRTMRFAPTVSSFERTYYFISTLVSVVTTLIMRKTTNEEALLAQLEANKKDPKKMKKTGFAARLEAMQKQQEQMMKEKQNKK